MLGSPNIVDAALSLTVVRQLMALLRSYPRFAISRFLLRNPSRKDGVSVEITKLCQAVKKKEVGARRPHGAGLKGLGDARTEVL